MNEKYLNFRTDMADERVDTYKKVKNVSEVDGIKVETKNKDGIITTVVEVLNEQGKEALKKEIGKYITIEIADLSKLEKENNDEVSIVLGEKIKELIGEDNAKSILVVGLGNEAATPDALGPKVTKEVNITRHIINFAKEFVEPNTRSISAIAPGVLGTTGIETSEIIFSIVEKIKPDIIIAIDSLASGSIHRIGNTIQLSNTGITPGAGVRNKREGLNENTLGVPVIAIGVPTVVDMATITNEAIDKMLDSAKSEIKEFSDKITEKKKIESIFEYLEKDTRYDMIANILNTENYIVTPKEVDEVIEEMSAIIACGINKAV